ncbi:MAG: Fic family protein [Deltaproteobacteria bacterium]|nr:MAG: Fic family protein [Deltaproteobacteria bacterium]
MAYFKHISFKQEWNISPQCAYMIGECDAYVKTLTDIPLKPKTRQNLLTVALTKGAQATTAIEGNTLNEEEIEKISQGWSLPPSKKYQEIEVKNVLTALNHLLSEIVEKKNIQPITPESICFFHKLIGKDLGDHLDAIPGKFRQDARFVGPYKTPDHRKISTFVENLCSWLRKDFCLAKEQSFSESVIQAIIAHVYIEWIHPFGDGNGRTGRLIEFYILLGAGLPSICSHILSNHYNLTRPEYYRHLNESRKKRDLTDFLFYAVQGFRDGLRQTLDVIQNNQFSIYWQNYIYEVFSAIKYTKKNVFKRKRELMLNMPLDKVLSIDQITEINPSITKKYARVTRTTVLRDLKDLRDSNLLVKEGKDKYRANIGIMKNLMF